MADVNTTTNIRENVAGPQRTPECMLPCLCGEQYSTHQIFTPLGTQTQSAIPRYQIPHAYIGARRIQPFHLAQYDVIHPEWSHLPREKDRAGGDEEKNIIFLFFECNSRSHEQLSTHGGRAMWTTETGIYVCVCAFQFPTSNASFAAAIHSY